MNEIAQIITTFTAGIIAGAGVYAAGYFHGKNSRPVDAVQRARRAVSRALTFGPAPDNPNEKPDIKIGWGDTL